MTSPRLLILSCVVGLTACAAPRPPEEVAVVRLTAFLPAEPEPTPAEIRTRRALEAEWPPVDFAPEHVLPDPERRQVRPRVRWVTTASGEVVEAPDELLLLESPVQVRVVRLPATPSFLLDPGE